MDREGPWIVPIPGTPEAGATVRKRRAVSIQLTGKELESLDAITMTAVVHGARGTAGHLRVTSQGQA